MDNRPIGMLDSGIGGVTVLKEIINKCPNEDIIYLGDTKNFPYGNKAKEEIVSLTKKGIEFLISKGAKMIIIACGTATSQALEEVQKCYNIPIIGIIDETVEYVKEKEYKNVGVIATEGTIRSKSWENKLFKAIPDVVVANKACPLLAPMAEKGLIDNEVTKATIKMYLKRLKNVDCLILGCTHYPLFSNIIKEELGEEKEIIDTGVILGKKLKKILAEDSLETSKKELEGKQKYQIYITSMEQNFVKTTGKLLQDEKIDEKIQLIDI